MAANTTHPECDSSLPAWLRAPDVFAAENAAKAAGERNLARLDPQSEKQQAAINDKTL